MNRRTDWFAMRLSAEERAQIEALAERQGITFSAAVRGAIRKVLHESEPRPASSADRIEARSFVAGA